MTEKKKISKNKTNTSKVLDVDPAWRWEEKKEYIPTSFAEKFLIDYNNSRYNNFLADGTHFEQITFRNSKLEFKTIPLRKIYKFRNYYKLIREIIKRIVGYPIMILFAWPYISLLPENLQFVFLILLGSFIELFIMKNEIIEDRLIKTKRMHKDKKE